VLTSEYLTEEWRKAKCSESGGCVWARLWNGLVEVTGSAPTGNGPDLEGPALRFTLHEWASFLHEVREGHRFDLPETIVTWSVRSRTTARGDPGACQVQHRSSLLYPPLLRWPSRRPAM
jgi:hypothetical protein